MIEQASPRLARRRGADPDPGLRPGSSGADPLRPARPSGLAVAAAPLLDRHAGLRDAGRRPRGDARVGPCARPSATGSCAWSTTARPTRRCADARSAAGRGPPHPGRARESRTAASSPPPTTPWRWPGRVRRPARPRRRAPPGRPAHVHAAIGGDPEVDYVYTDEDKIDATGRHGGPFLKPDWSPERMRTQMYTCHLSVLRRSLVEEVGGFDAEFEGSQDWDLVLRVTERARDGAPRAARPLPLARARDLDAAPDGGEAAKPWAFDAGTRAIQAHCDRTGVPATRRARPRGPRRLPPRAGLSREPLVSIVIPTGGQRREVRYEEVTLVEHCVRSIVEDSTYANYEIVVVADPTPPRPADELRARSPAIGSPGRLRPPLQLLREDQRAAPSTAAGEHPAAAERRHRGRRRPTGSSGW